MICEVGSIGRILCSVKYILLLVLEAVDVLVVSGDIETHHFASLLPSS